MVKLTVLIKENNFVSTLRLLLEETKKNETLILGFDARMAWNDEKRPAKGWCIIFIIYCNEESQK